MSGRHLKKVPFLAHALKIQVQSYIFLTYNLTSMILNTFINVTVIQYVYSFFKSETCNLENFIDAMSKTIEQQNDEKCLLATS